MDGIMLGECKGLLKGDENISIYLLLIMKLLGQVGVLLSLSVHESVGVGGQYLHQSKRWGGFCWRSAVPKVMCVVLDVTSIFPQHCEARSLTRLPLSRGTSYSHHHPPPAAGPPAGISLLLLIDCCCSVGGCPLLHGINEK